LELAWAQGGIPIATRKTRYRRAAPPGKCGENKRKQRSTKEVSSGGKKKNRIANDQGKLARKKTSYKTRQNKGNEMGAGKRGGFCAKRRAAGSNRREKENNKKLRAATKWGTKLQIGRETEVPG